MDKIAFADELFNQLDDLATAEGLQLVDVEIKGQMQRPIVIVYLDKDGGIGIDVLAAANRWIGAALDDCIDSAYTLEVSSPGGRERKKDNG
ncbi:MAG: hypothetical protein FWC81_01475 [Coriobacteriia bacterium]|nr:hypothetical protein [Coriobacteriia bacterium]MCL2606417.1 hypothetical protein [Coriobacteriia bacterium]